MTGEICQEGSARQDQRIIANDAADKEKERIEVEEQQTTRTSTLFRNPEGDRLKCSSPVQGDGDISLAMLVTRFLRRTTCGRTKEINSTKTSYGFTFSSPTMPNLIVLPWIVVVAKRSITAINGAVRRDNVKCSLCSPHALRSCPLMIRHDCAAFKTSR